MVIGGWVLQRVGKGVQGTKGRGGGAGCWVLQAKFWFEGEEGALVLSLISGLFECVWLACFLSAA